MTNFNFKPRKHPNEYGWYNLDGLPHFDAPFAQFITFRLADSLPSKVVERFRVSTTDDAVFRKKVEKYLDSGHGACWLRYPEIAAMVRDALRFHDGKKYDLKAWVIMPNHAHILLVPNEGEHLDKILHSIKSYTAQKANKLLGRSGQFWQHESFDRYIRNAKHYQAVVRYIEENPVKAGFCSTPEEWIFSSAYGHPVDKK